jgi:hypothetical protein
VEAPSFVQHNVTDVLREKQTWVMSASVLPLGKKEKKVLRCGEQLADTPQTQNGKGHFLP